MGDLKTITKVPVGAVALMGAVIYAILGLIWGILSALSILAGVSAIQNALPSTVSLGSGAALAATAIIGGVVFGFIGGYIIIAIVALLYNWLAPRIGGVKLELQ